MGSQSRTRLSKWAQHSTACCIKCSVRVHSCGVTIPHTKDPGQARAFITLPVQKESSHTSSAPVLRLMLCLVSRLRVTDPMTLGCTFQTWAISCGSHWPREVKWKIQFLNHTDHLSRAQQLHVAKGYCPGQYAYRPLTTITELYFYY